MSLPPDPGHPLFPVARYEQLLSTERRRPTSREKRSLAEEALSDRSRVIFSAPFRRLQKKAQVFSLEDNAAIRSRLIHSMEVAFFGRMIALKVVERLSHECGIPSPSKSFESLRFPFVDFVETACLLHDIGNPPFGHFGESAIQGWFDSHGLRSFLASANLKDEHADAKLLKSRLLPDLCRFDGNAQGFRIITRLQWVFDEHSLNLTYAQLGAYLKYAYSADELADHPGQKKPGYFFSEKSIKDAAWTALSLGVNQRHPLAYIVEAADDIAFCLSDMEDGIEKGVITGPQVLAFLEQTAQAESTRADLVLEALNSAGDGSPADHPLHKDDPTAIERARFLRFKTAITHVLIDRVVSAYCNHHALILAGSPKALVDLDPAASATYDALKAVAREHLYRSPEAEKPELAGHRIVTGLLDRFRPLLCVSRDTFDRITRFEVPPRAEANTDLERRLYNLLPAKHRYAYKHAVAQSDQQDRERRTALEWFHRAHLIVDYIAGMTDVFALELFQRLSGIRIG